MHEGIDKIKRNVYKNNNIMEENRQMVYEIAPLKITTTLIRETILVQKSYKENEVM